MLDEEFYRRRANLIREIAGRADPFIKRRLLDLVARYEKGPVKTKPLPPMSISREGVLQPTHDEK